MCLTTRMTAPGRQHQFDERATVRAFEFSGAAFRRSVNAYCRPTTVTRRIRAADIPATVPLANAVVRVLTKMSSLRPKRSVELSERMSLVIRKAALSAIDRAAELNVSWPHAGSQRSLRYPTLQGLRCYMILFGTCWFFVDGDEEPVHSMAGDCVLLKSTASLSVKRCGDRLRNGCLRAPHSLHRILPGNLP